MNLEPTHRCKVCGAYWRKNPPDAVFKEGSWTWVTIQPNPPPCPTCGPCCDNVLMGEQIKRLDNTILKDLLTDLELYISDSTLDIEHPISKAYLKAAPSARAAGFWSWPDET